MGLGTIRQPDPTIERLKERGWREVAAVNGALERGEIDEDGWHQAMAALIRPAYLAADSVYAQAGHSGNAETWEASRRFLVEAIHRDGTFLDVGCANGILMESVHRWAKDKGYQIEPYGLDIVPEFVSLAQKRLPHWANRIFEGNIRTWRPPQGRFDFVLLRPEYAPSNRRNDMIRHVLDSVVKPGGRLILFIGTEERACRAVESGLAQGGLAVSGRLEIPHNKDERVVRRVVWMDAD